MFTEERTNDAVRLIGIYHISTNVMFEEGKRPENLVESVILIDDVEMKGNEGYFEYAVPLNIDLPGEAENPLERYDEEHYVNPDGQGSFGIIWDVECTF